MNQNKNKKEKKNRQKKVQKMAATRHPYQSRMKNNIKLSSLYFGFDPDRKLTQDVGRFCVLTRSLGTGFCSSGACHRNNGERG